MYRDDLLDSLFGFSPYFPIQVENKSEYYLVKVVAPGFKKQEFEITMEENILHIIASSEEEGVYNINQKIELRNADVENIKAKYESGVLRIKVSKKQIKKIEIS